MDRVDATADVVTLITPPHSSLSQVLDRVDATADADLARAIWALVAHLGGSGTTGKEEDGAGFGGLHVMLSEEAISNNPGILAGIPLLDAARMTDASGRTVPAPPEVWEL